MKNAPERLVEKTMMRSRLVGWLGLLALLGYPPAPRAHAAENGRRPMQFADLMNMRRLGDMALSPDGKWVLFSLTDADLERNTRTSHLWVVPAAGGNEKPVTASSCR